ncbi:ribosome assembly RNA-binding protein YhbY [Convivina praedatoris]|uniref:RNA-binding protein YhbY n=1 Tax=Convivina praedatoris TaxID=2880963 RepID=A0ABM9D3D9_9LACO|nr:ribosome assembly RNA-binding protein YhbY [Convivina sp. LMG 32447]CAH1852637.1 RNA-binding protein YhbY [Convivina sp. LMG 32447]CAH1852683.1 RNA-binding protein YhbY [Convivina sp. LMG 32447]CAH1854899.1 RNA-binding protein YhbY [Convivina sp. LMG 32447]
MQKLSGKQKRYLRASANPLSPIFSIGKNGLNQQWVNEVVAALAKRELIKVSIQQTAEVDVKDLAEFLHQHSEITVVQTIGRTAVLYLPAKEEKYAKLSPLVAKL